MSLVSQFSINRGSLLVPNFYLPSKQIYLSVPHTRVKVLYYAPRGLRTVWTSARIQKPCLCSLGKEGSDSSISVQLFYYCNQVDFALPLGSKGRI